MSNSLNLPAKITKLKFLAFAKDNAAAPGLLNFNLFSYKFLQIFG
jgi:hypothetical protein